MFGVALDWVPGRWGRVYSPRFARQQQTTRRCEANPKAGERDQEAGQRPVGLRFVAAVGVEAWRRREKQRLDLERPSPKDPRNLELATFVRTGGGDVELDKPTSFIFRALSQSLIPPPCFTLQNQ
jgi:hypothetical protein